MYAIKNSLFFVVGAIILLHTVVHHEHTKATNTLEIKPQEYCSSIADSILKSFALNHGDGHLEHFIDVEFDNPELLLSEIIQVVFIDEDNLFNGVDNVEIYTTLSLPPNPLRGPPC